MVGKPDDSRRKIEKGRQDVADTSSAITEKLATLEHRVQESVDAVKHGVDFHYQVKQRPWRRAPIPLASAVVSSLARPGGNVTGLSTIAVELSGSSWSKKTRSER